MIVLPENSRKYSNKILEVNIKNLRNLNLIKVN